MAHPVLSVCIFCLICATHSPCGSHAAVNHESLHIKDGILFKNSKNTPLITTEETLSRVKLKHELVPTDTSGNVKNETPLIIKNHSLSKRNSVMDEKSDSSSNISKENYLSKIFERFGNGKTMTMEGFEKFIERLDLLQIISTKLDSESSREGAKGNSTVQKGKNKNTVSN